MKTTHVRFRGPGRLIAFALAAMGAPWSARAGQSPPGAVYPDNSRLRPFFEAARNQRVALVGVGDSNQLFNTTGWENGWFDALASRYGIWGTALISAGEGTGYGSSVGTGAGAEPSSPLNVGDFVFSGAPLPFELLMSSVSAPVPPAGFLYVPWYAAGVDPVPPHGMYLTASSGLDLNAALRFHFTHALFNTGRSLNAYVSEGNWGGPPLASVGFSTRIPPSAFAAVPDPARAAGDDRAVLPAPAVTNTVDLSAGTRSAYLRMWFGDERERARGPLFLTYMQAENPGRASGFAVHTLYGLAGASAWGMANALHAASDAQLSLFFERVRTGLGPNPKVIVRINSGVNDRSEFRPSYLSSILPGFIAPAFRDNVDAVVSRIRGIWELNRWDAASELRFLVTVSHPISNPDDVLLESYRAALSRLADDHPDITLVNIASLANASEIASRGWYHTPDDRFHLDQGGYISLARRELAALVWRPCCEPADMDDDGAVGTRDLVALLSDFASPTLTTGQGGDLDGDGLCDTRDLVRLLARFGLSTCNAGP